MKRLTYTEPIRMSRPDILAALESDPTTCTTAVLAAAWFDEVSFAETVVMTASSHADPMVRGIAITSIGHLARIHKDVDSTRRLLGPLRMGFLDVDQGVRGKAGDAADDIEVFIPSLQDEVACIRAKAGHAR